MAGRIGTAALKLVLLLVLLALLADDGDGWRRRRRRRRAAVCTTWNVWSSCAVTCGLGTKTRYRTCPTAMSANANCYTTACPVNCKFNSWGAWGGCSSACGSGVKLRYRYINVYSSGGGTACPSRTDSTSCSSTSGCPAVNCLVNNWGSFGTCNAGCNTAGDRTRYRSVTRYPQYGGSACPTTSQTLSCSACCVSNCVMNQWSGYSSCSASCGSGYRYRSRSIARGPSCGGAACPSQTTQAVTCTGSSVATNCQVNSWGGWGSCSYSSSCGYGNRYRYRSVRVNAVCGGSGCPGLSATDSTSCYRCCPTSCTWNSWGSYGTCTASCGTGFQYRYRTVRTSASCGGACPGSGSSSTSCSNYVKRDCVVGAWTAYTPCTNPCGSGTKTRTRPVISAATCGGSCPVTSDTVACTSYLNKDCTVGGWGAWGSCDATCSIGKFYRYRSVLTAAVCQGQCPQSLTDSLACGTVNGGCKQLCNNGVCSCTSGYVLNSDAKSCDAKVCGLPSIPSYCPTGKVCKKPSVTCSSGYSYSDSCTLQCVSGYSLKGGPSAIICQSSGVWTDFSSVYCLLDNQAPVAISLSNTFINENSPIGKVVGSLTTTDPNPSDTHTYLLTDSAGGKFRIVGSSLATTFVPDYEQDPHSYGVTVKSTDQGGLSFTQTFTIGIRDVNEVPSSCSLTPSKVDENPALDTLVGKLSTVDQDTAQTHSYTLIGSAGGKFKLNGDSVEIAQANTLCLADGGAKCQFNFESSTLNKFSITVRTQDNGSPYLWYDCTLDIDLNNVNDKPRDLKLDGYTIKEGSAVGTKVGALTSSDEDAGQTMTYTLTDDDSGRFSISQNKYVVAAKVANFETQTSHHITVRGTDNGSPALYVEKSFTITVLDIKEAPVAIQLTSTASQQSFPADSPKISENSVLNTVLGTVVASDPDKSAVLTFSLDDDAGGRFKLDAGSNVLCAPPTTPSATVETVCSVRVLVSGVLNHEIDALHTIVVRATDNHGLFKVQRFSVNVLDVNDIPHDIVSVGRAPKVKENLNDYVVTSFVTSDQDPANVHTYTLVSNLGSKFKILGSRLMTTAAANLNYELKSSYTIVVRSTDNGSPVQYFEKTFTVTVLDVNEVPTAVALSGGNVDENSAIDSIVGAMTVTDPDNLVSARQSFTYTLVDPAQGRFKLSANSVQVAQANVDCLKYGGSYCKLDYEMKTSHDITVQVTDSGSPPLSKTFVLTIKLNNINDKPRHLTLNNTIVKENEPADTVVGYLAYSDEDIAQTHAVNLTNNDNGQFKLSSDGTSLLKAKPTNYKTKTVHKITVRVTDNGSPPLWIETNFSISVTDINEAPVKSIFKDTNGQHTFADDLAKVNENSRAGVIVGTIEAHDSDNNQQLKFSLDSDANGHFSVDSTAACTFATGSVCTASLRVFGPLDHEDSSTDFIVVRVTDPQGKFKVTQFPITIIDVNDAPTNITFASGNPRVVENKADAVVGAFVTTDDDNLQTHTYTLVNDANGRFRILNGELRTIVALDYEQTPTLTIRVRSTDSGTPPLSYEKNFVVHVIDINEKPTALHISAHQVDENSASNTAVGLLTTSDPDNEKTSWQTFTYALQDTVGGRFGIDRGVLKVRTSNVACLALGGTSCWLNYEMKPYYTLLVRTTDSGSPPLSVDFALNVTLKDINDRPRNLQLSDYRVHENQPIGTVIGTLSGFDEDTLQHLTYVLTDDDDGRFKIVGNELQKAQSANYEVFKSHYITVVMMDDGTPSLNISKSFLIEILNVNEAPVQTNFTDSGGQLTFTKDLPEVEENSPVGTIVGTIISIDVDYTQTLTFHLDDDASGRFNLTSTSTSQCQAVTDLHGHHSSCKVQLLVASSLNYETTKTHDIVVRVTDNDGLFNVQRFTIKVVDVNDVPHDIQILARTVDENSQLVFISDFVTLDEDKTHTHTYSLTSNPGNQFAIVNNSLYASPTATLNYEKQQQWTIKIMSVDDGTPALHIEEVFVLDVLDVNEAPSEVNITGNTVDENSPVNTVVGELQVTDPDNFGPKGRWQNASCYATDNAGGVFTVAGNVVKVAQSSIDYEVNTNFSMTVLCTDDGVPALSKSWTFTIFVMNTNERPTGVNITNDEIAENSENGTLVGVLSTTDPDNENMITQTFSYKILQPVPNLPFEILGDRLVVAGTLDYEINPSWPVVVQSTDSAGLSLIHVFQINLLDLNEPPTALQLIAAGYVAENSPADSYIGDVLAVDEDASQSHTFEVLGAAAGVLLNSSTMDPSLSDAFVINTTSGVLTTGNHTWDYEVTPSYTVWIRTMDDGLVPSFSFVDIIIVNISDINEAPTNITLDNDKVAENSAIGTIVGHLTVTDPDNYGVHAGSQTFSCSVLNAIAHSFKVVNSTVLVVSKENLDFERQVSHDIEIQCWDSDLVSPLFLNKQFTINLTNVNEEPSMIKLSNLTIGEELGPRAELGVITAVDPDNAVEEIQNVTFKLQMQNTSDVPFVLVDGNIVEATQNLDFETRSLYTLTVDATDTGVPPLTTQEQFNVTVLDMNDPPTQVVLNSSGILETSPIGTVIGTLSTVDGDIGQTYIYAVLSIPNGTDSTMFGIRGNQLLLLTPVNYETENMWTVMVESTDSGQPPISHMNTVTVRVLDVNEVPSEIHIDYNATVEENVDAGTVVANFTVVDEDLNQTHTCRLVQGQQNFVLANAMITGEDEITIEVARNASLDYETSPVVSITINCTDSGVPQLSIAKTINIKLEDVNEQPTAVILSGPHTVAENAPRGYVLGRLSTVDQDKGQVYTYIVFGNGSDTFNVDEIYGHLEVQSTAWLNFEALTNPFMELTIEVWDNGQPALGYNQSINITIIDINEPPTDIRLLGDKSLREDADDGTIIGELYCNNPEKNQTITYDIEQTGQDLTGPVFGVYVNGTSSFLQMIARNNFTEDTDGFVFVVNATDDGHPAQWSIGTVRVNLTLLDPCSTGAVLCPTGAYCERQNMSYGYCECDDGHLLDPVSKECEKIDNCLVTVDTGDFPSTTSPPSEEGGPQAPQQSTQPPPPIGSKQAVCMNNASCISLENGFNCTCASGFSGTQCQVRIDRCLTAYSSCLHGSMCVDSPAAMTCVCSAGYSGSRCETNVDDCVGVSCGDGVCDDGVDKYSCVCSEVTEGSNCQYVKGACDGSPCGEDDCVPRKLPAPQAASGGTTGREDGSPSVNVDTPGISVGDGGTESSNFICVPVSQTATVKFSGGAVTPKEKAAWVELLRDTRLPGDDGTLHYPDDVYVLPVSTGTELIVVAILDDTPVDPLTVDQAMAYSCLRRDLSPSAASLCGRWLNKPEAQAGGTISPQRRVATTAPPSSDSKTLVWAVVAGLLALMLAITMLVTYKVYSAKKKMRSTHTFGGDIFNDVAAEHASNHGDSGGVTGGFQRNPLYYDPMPDPVFSGNRGSVEVTSPVYEGSGPEGDYDTMDRTDAEADECVYSEITAARLTQSPGGGLGVSNPTYNSLGGANHQDILQSRGALGASNPTYSSLGGTHDQDYVDMTGSEPPPPNAAPFSINEDISDIEKLLE